MQLLESTFDIDKIENENNIQTQNEEMPVQNQGSSISENNKESEEDPKRDEQIQEKGRK